MSFFFLLKRLLIRSLASLDLARDGKKNNAKRMIYDDLMRRSVHSCRSRSQETCELFLLFLSIYFFSKSPSIFSSVRLHFDSWISTFYRASCALFNLASAKISFLSVTRNTRSSFLWANLWFLFFLLCQVNAIDVSLPPLLIRSMFQLIRTRRTISTEISFIIQ